MALALAVQVPAVFIFSLFLGGVLRCITLQLKRVLSLPNVLMYHALLCLYIFTLASYGCAAAAHHRWSRHACLLSLFVQGTLNLVWALAVVLAVLWQGRG